MSSRRPARAEVRAASGADREAILSVERAALGGPAEPELVERIWASENYVPELDLVADADGHIAGHVIFSYATLRGEAGRRILQLSPLAVDPQYQKKGLGGALVRQGLDRCEVRREPLVVVLGHPAYYPRFGFEPARGRGILPPTDDIRDEAFMVKLLSAYDPEYKGRLVYPPAFTGGSGG